MKNKVVLFLTLFFLLILFGIVGKVDYEFITQEDPVKLEVRINE